MSLASLSETFPLDGSLNHVELYRRLNAFTGNWAELNTHAILHLSVQELSACQIIAFSYRKDEDVAKMLRTLISGYLLPLEVSERLLATCVVPSTPAADLVAYIQEITSPFFRDRMVGLLKRSKRHDVVDGLLNSAKLSEDQLSGVYHLATSEQVEQSYLMYHYRVDGGVLKIENILRFHQDAYLANMQLLLDNELWQGLHQLWNDYIFNLSPHFHALKDEKLIEKLYKLYLTYPPCTLLNDEYQQLEDVEDKFKTLNGIDMVVSWASILPFDRLFHFLTSNPTLTEPNVIWIGFVDALWKHLISRTELKGEEVKQVASFICSKVDNISTLTALPKNTIVHLISLQQKHWNDLFVFCLSNSSKLITKAGNGLTMVLLDKMTALWKQNFATMTFLTSSDCALVLREEMFSKFDNILINDVFTLVKHVERAITSRFDSLLSSFVNNAKKSVLFQSMTAAYQALFKVYQLILSDVISLSSTVNVEYLLSFQGLVSKIVRAAVSTFDALKGFLSTNLRKNLRIDQPAVIQVRNDDIDQFMKTCYAEMSLPGFAQWMQSWWGEVEAFLLHSADQSVAPTVLSNALTASLFANSTNFDMITSLRKEYLPWSDVCVAYEKLRKVMLTCREQLLRAGQNASAAYCSAMQFNANLIISLWKLVLTRILTEQSSWLCAWDAAESTRAQSMAHEIVLDLYELKQWGSIKTEKTLTSLTQAKYYDSMSFLQGLMERDIPIPAHMVITLDQLLGEQTSSELAQTYTVLFTDMRKDLRYPAGLFNNARIKSKYYLALQALVWKMVSIAATRRECSAMLDMFCSANWSKDNIPPVAKNSIFDEIFLEYLPVDDSRVVRHLKRRVSIAVSVEDKLVVYAAVVNASALHNQAWSKLVSAQRTLLSQRNVEVLENTTKDYFLQATQVVLPLIAKIAFQSKALPYPVDFNNFLEYIPTMEDLMTPSIQPKLTAERIDQVLATLQSICDARFQVEATSYVDILDGIIDRMSKKAWQSFVDLLKMAVAMKASPMTLYNVEHAIEITKRWLDLLCKLHFTAFERVHGQKHARAEYVFNTTYYRASLANAITRGYEAKFFEPLGVSKVVVLQQVHKAVFTETLGYLWGFYCQYVTEMPLTVAIYRQQGQLLSTESIEVINTFLSLAMMGHVYEDVHGLRDMLRVCIAALQSEEEYRHNFDNYRNVAEAFAALDVNIRPFEARKLTFGSVLFHKSVEEDQKVLNVAEMDLLKCYKHALLHEINPARFQHFPTTKLLFINRRIAEFDQPELSDLDVLLNSIEEICANVCPSILRYKFICQLLVQHRPQVIFKYLSALGVVLPGDSAPSAEEESEEAAMGGKQHAILIKRNDAFSLPFTSRQFRLTLEQRKVLATLSRSIILDHEKSSLLHRRRAVDWLTSLKVLSLDEILQLYQQLIPDASSDIVLPPVLKKSLLINGIKSSSADVKTLLGTIFRPELFNDADLTLALIQLLSEFAKIYGQVFTNEIRGFLQPSQPMFAKIGVTTFKAIIRLCESLLDASTLLLSFWAHRQSLHRDVQTTILNTMLTMYISEEEERLRIGSVTEPGTTAKAIYQFAQSITINNDLDAELFRTLLRVQPNHSCVESVWQVGNLRAPQGEGSWMMLNNAQLCQDFFQQVVQPTANRMFDFPPEIYENIVECIKTWIGTNISCTQTVRTFFFHVVETMKISLPNTVKSNHDIEMKITRRCLDYLKDLIAVSKKTFNQHNTDPVDQITVMFKQYLSQMNQSLLTRAEQFSLMQKIRMIQNTSEFKIFQCYKTMFEPREMDELEVFYSTMSEIYTNIKRNKYAT